MRCRRAPVHLWAHGSSFRSLAFPTVRTFGANKEPRDPPIPGKVEAMKERTAIALQTAGQLGRQWGQRSAQTASVTMNYWWERYEDFVGLNEVREAQTKVTEAESAFMVSRGMVSEAHSSLEALQLRLKEGRARVDRVSREEAHYLELATLEHKLLQEERRLRTAYENAESSEREKFALFSAAVRASHEKERTRAERTKNWSIIGSVLGALIGVMGSTYINRVRLQELKALLLEAQKGPENLQEALKVQAGNHRSQQEELRSLIDSLRGAVGVPTAVGPDVPLGALTEICTNTRQATSELQVFKEQLEQLQRGVGGVQGQLVTVRRLLEATPPEERTLTEHSQLPDTPAGCHLTETETVVRRLEETQRILGERMRTNTLYNAVFTYSASAIAVCTVYVLLRGAA